MLLFLDFDGVMRRTTSRPMVFDADCLACFERALEALPAYDVAVTSSWRDILSLAEIRSRFSPAVAARIVGVVPTVHGDDAFPRHREVLEFLRRAGRESERWIGVDDDRRAYPGTCRVVWTDPERGFDEDAGRRLAALAGELERIGRK